MTVTMIGLFVACVAALPISVHVPGFNTAEIAIDVLRLCESVPFARRGSIDIGPSIDTLDLDIADLA